MVESCVIWNAKIGVRACVRAFVREWAMGRRHLELLE
jgi:hypothetical protein